MLPFHAYRGAFFYTFVQPYSPAGRNGNASDVLSSGRKCPPANDGKRISRNFQFAILVHKAYY
jgi:hypothetical protein